VASNDPVWMPVASCTDDEDGEGWFPPVPADWRTLTTVEADADNPVDYGALPVLCTRSPNDALLVQVLCGNVGTTLRYGLSVPREYAQAYSALRPLCVLLALHQGANSAVRAAQLLGVLLAAGVELSVIEFLHGNPAALRAVCRHAAPEAEGSLY